MSGIWPEVELTDSEDESLTPTAPKRLKKDLKPSGITDEDITGCFPSLKSLRKSDCSDDDDDSDSDGDDDAETKSLSSNPYLMADNDIKTKYDNQLRQLHLKRNEARKLNHQEVAAEDQRNKLPSNYEARRRKAEWELEDKKARQAAEECGEDYDRVKLLNETAENVEIFDRKKRKKKNQDPGFSDYAASQLRQYERLTNQMQPDMQAYETNKQILGKQAFPSAHNLMYGSDNKIPEAGIDRMVTDLEKQIDKRSKFHRRRQHHDEADIDYINERNMKFNQKAERYYGQYTQEIKNNLERGTAI